MFPKRTLTVMSTSNFIWNQKQCENNGRESRGKTQQWSGHWLKDSDVEVKAEAPCDAHCREVVVFKYIENLL